jgi:hypothetical protein
MKDRVDKSMGIVPSIRVQVVLQIVWGTGTPKDRDEVNEREVCECDE